MTLTRRGALAGCVAALISAPSRAHRLHLALTTVEWRGHRNALEVVHRLYAHDVAEALRASGAPADLDDLRTRASAALHVAQRFQLLGEGGDELALEVVGAELEADYLFVYQEAVLERPPEIAAVFAGALLGDLDAQVNTVNVDLGQGVRTVEFRAGDAAKPLA